MTDIETVYLKDIDDWFESGEDLPVAVTFWQAIRIWKEEREKCVKT